MRRILSWMAGLAVLAILCLGLLYGLRHSLLTPHLIAFLTEQVEEQLGLELTVAELRGSYFTSLELRGVETEQPAPDGPVISLRLRRGRLEYNPLHLWRGVDAFLARTRVQLEGLKTELKPADGGRTEPAPSEGPPGPLLLPAVLPQVTVEDGALTLQGPDYGVELEGVSVRSEPPDGEVQPVSVEVETLRWHHPAVRDGNTSFSALLRYRPERIELQRLLLGERQVVQHAHLDLDAAPERLPFGAKLRAFGGTLSTEGTADADRLQLQLAADGVELGNAVALLADPAPDLAGLLTLESELHLLYARPQELTADVDLGLASFHFGPLHADAVTAELRAADGGANLNRLALTTGGNRVTATNLHAPLAPIFDSDWDRLARQLRGRFAADSSNLPALLHRAGFRKDKLPTELPDHRFSLEGEFAEGTLVLTEGRLEAGANTALLEEAEVVLPPSGQPLGDASVTLALRAGLEDLAALSSLLPGPAFSGQLNALIRLHGTLAGPQGSAQVSGQALTLEDVPLGSLRVQASADAERITASTVVLEGDGHRVRGHGTYSPATRRFEGVVADLEVTDLGAHAARLAPELGLHGGRVQAHLELEGPLEQPSARATLTAEELAIEDVPVSAAALRARTEDRILSVEEVTVRGAFGAVSARGTLARAADPGAWTVQLQDLRAARGEADLALQESAELRIAPGRLHFTDVVLLAGSVGTVRALGIVDWEGESDLLVEVSDWTSRGWLPEWVDGVAFRGADLEFRFAGTREQPDLSLQGAVPELELAGFPQSLRLQTNLRATPTFLRIEQLDCRDGGGNGISANGSLPWNPMAPDPFVPGPLQLEARLEIPDLQSLDELLPEPSGVRGELSADLSLQGEWQEPTGTLQIHTRSFQAPDQALPLPPGPLDLAATLSLDSDVLRLQNASIQGPFLTASAEGRYQEPVSLLALVRDREVKWDGPFTARAQVSSPDIQWLAEDIGALRRIGGEVRADLEASGSLAHPEVTGSLRWSEGELRVDGPLPGMSDLFLEAQLRSSRVHVETLRGEMGSAPFRLEGDLDWGGEDESAANFTLNGTNLLLYRDDGVKVRADVSVRVRGPLSALEIGGEIALTEGRLVKNVNFLDLLRGSSTPQVEGRLFDVSFPDPPLRDATLDLQVTSQNPFRIRSNVAQLALRPELQIRGTGATPILLGEVYVESGQVELPAGRLRIESGVIRFLETAPDRPRLDIHAGARLMGYDITVLVQGSYDEPEVTMSSSPPLPNDELLLLVLAGTPPRSEVEEGAARQSGLRIATYLGRSMLGTLMGSESTESDESLLDRFDLQIGRGVTETGEETIEASFRLAEDVLTPRDQLYLVGEKDVYDDYNTGIRIVFRFE